MGAICSHNRSSTPAGFTSAVVKSVSPSEKKVKLFIPARKLTFETNTDTSMSVARGNEVYCLINDHSTLITPVCCKGNFETSGEVLRPSSAEYLLFKSQTGESCALPLCALRSSFEVTEKPVPCLLTRTETGTTLRIRKIDPFRETAKDEGETKRHVGRFRRRIAEKGKTEMKGLQGTYSAWRYVKNDENGLFRCVYTQFLEHLCRKTTPLSELTTFLAQVDSKTGYFALVTDYQQYASRVSALLHKLQSVKETELGEELPTLQWALQDSSVDVAWIQYLRLLVANYVAVHYRSARLKRFMSADAKEVVSGLLTFTQQPDIIAKYVLPELLGVVILQHDVCDEVFESLYAPEKEGVFPLIHMCTTAAGACYILYSEAHILIDGYDFDTHEYDLSTPGDTQRKAAEELYQTISLSQRDSIQT